MPVTVLLQMISVYLFLLLCGIISVVHGVGEVIWAVNCGGEAHTDVHGVRYQRDTQSSGIASDFGRGLNIQRVAPQDQILYQTERYDVDTFGYDIPIQQDGKYVLVLKFCEVWFTASNQKVFDVSLNNHHIVVDQLDIYHQVGRGSAHDEVIPFTVKGKQLHVFDQVSVLESSKLRVDFIKGDKDNPKINAMYLMKGTVEDVPELPPIPGKHFADEEEDDTDEEDYRSSSTKRKIAGEPKVQDPYAADDPSSMLLPVVVAVAAFIPLVFCLCRL